MHSFWETKTDRSKNWWSPKQKAKHEEVRTSSSLYLSQLTHDWTAKFLLKCQGFVCGLLTPISLWHLSSVIIVNFLHKHTMTLLYRVEKTAPPYWHIRVECKNYFWSLKTRKDLKQSASLLWQHTLNIILQRLNILLFSRTQLSELCFSLPHYWMCKFTSTDNKNFTAFISAFMPSSGNIDSVAEICCTFIKQSKWSTLQW